MRVVFDTHVIIAGLVAEGLCREVVETHLPDHTAILSRLLWNELAEKLWDKFALSSEELPLLHLYRRHATWVEPRSLREPVCRDPDDDWVSATAVAGAAEAIVTGDDDLLSIGEFEGVKILTPRDFVAAVA